MSNLGDNTYDLAIAGNLCHLFDENANHNLLARLYRAITPGGKIAIVDILPNYCPQTFAWATTGPTRGRGRPLRCVFEPVVCRR